MNAPLTLTDREKLANIIAGLRGLAPHLQRAITMQETALEAADALLTRAEALLKETDGVSGC